MAELLLPHWHPLHKRLAEPALLVPGRQPSGSIRLNDTAIVKDCVAAFCPANPLVNVNLAKGDCWSAVSIVRSLTSNGWGFNGDGNYLRTLTWPYTNLSLSQKFTFLWVADAGNEYTDSKIVNQGSSSRFGLYYTDSGNVICASRLSGEGSGSIKYTSTESFYGQRRVGVHRNNTGVGYQLWIDGRLDQDISDTRNIVASFSFSISAPMTSLRGNVLLAALWLRALSENEIVELSRNPYQIFRPANSSPYLLSIPGGATTLPTLTSPTLVSAGGNDYYPRVTATYS